ncbi:MAG: FAD-binding oxidoreductase [Cyclobacteriaceae bacterium]|nr:FAD-binding oxidoreductase [Cyclobacteriaceae bacterium]
MAQKKVDYIIVGLGLAGACLAVQLLRRGKRIMVYNTPNQNRASLVAAGLFNPITGKRIVKTWKADEIFSYLFKFYHDVESELQIKFFYDCPLYIPFQTVEEQNEWMSKSVDDSIKNYILQVNTQSTFGHEVKDPIGGILLSHCGHINTGIFLDGVKKLLEQTESYSEEWWVEEKLKISTHEGVEYENLSAEKIVYCTGIYALKSRYFDALPLRALKGEVITITTEKPLSRIYNRGAYVVESGEMEYKAGATYDLTNLKEGITLEGRKELEIKVRELLSMSFKVTHQDWGIRPSTVDRRPIIGVHPSQNNILIFNGLGAKGVSLAPYFSGQLADYIMGRGDLDKEANITRVKSLYSKFY